MNKIFILIFLFTQNLLFSQTIFLNENIDKFDKFEMNYIKDMTSSLNYNDIKETNFEERVSNRFSFGYINYPIWFKLELYNNSNKQNSFIIALEEPFFDSVNLIYEKNGAVYSIQNSVKDDILNRQQPHPNNHFKIILEPNETLNVYLKVRSIFSDLSTLYRTKKD
ncbi:hypothetical protein O8C85_11595 [Aliarcobacter butzleri]|uniref:7TMR-DISMED2 domain-containing protein n=1 Tax=Aliarcobacter butzleri TaxID=28197 RepID=UPI00263F6E72|nr:7TM-DISM domain-containing protein [Aliarcobacter butzleri]MDN5099167.1 hypothetical protein [Aliarcobacter butzleri]